MWRAMPNLQKQDIRRCVTFFISFLFNLVRGIANNAIDIEVIYSPEFYEGFFAAVRDADIHLSHVALCGYFAFKIKKSLKQRQRGLTRYA